MRIYTSMKEALNEITRDLAEMGIDIHPRSYQNKNVEGNPEFDTKELQNYCYTITNSKVEDIATQMPKLTKEWADAEFEERVFPPSMNPGEAYKLRPEVWNQFINDKGKFDYTYGERLKGRVNPNYNPDHYTQLGKVVDILTKDPNSRQAYMTVWGQTDLFKAGGNVRIPCTLGYLLQIREGKLNITYFQRSSDFSTHFQNDVYLACKMRDAIWTELEKNGVKVSRGMFTHIIGSLHIFKKDVQGVF